MVFHTEGLTPEGEGRGLAHPMQSANPFVLVVRFVELEVWFFHTEGLVPEFWARVCA